MQAVMFRVHAMAVLILGVSTTCLHRLVAQAWVQGPRAGVQQQISDQARIIQRSLWQRQLRRLICSTLHDFDLFV